MLVAIIAVNSYTLLTPFLPKATFALRDIVSNSQEKLDTEIKSEKIPDDNRLIIPSMQLSKPVYEGTRASTVHKGVWRRPNTSAPDRGGNTVLVGHRFTYSDPAVFYHLDKVKVGDSIALYWNKKKYLYKVEETKVVSPDAVEVEKNTKQPRLTLYSCTPLWSTRSRLVVIAKPVEEQL